MACNLFGKNNKVSRKFLAFTTFEILVSISIALIVIVPVNSYLTDDTLKVVKQLEDGSISMNLNYVVKQIREELVQAKFTDSDFIPLNGASSTLLQFNRFDGKLVRYYKIGKEIVKDYNYSTYNAITPKIVSSFLVERNDLNGIVTLRITIEGINEEVVSRTITKKSQF